MTTGADPNQLSRLLSSLPAVFQEDRLDGQASFLGRFLLGFEKLMLGLGDPAEPGLDETIGSLPRFFEPGDELLAEAERAPDEFLPWLAGWLALTLREDWDPDPQRRRQRQRNLIARASELYRRRGTKRGIEDFVRSYNVLGARVEEMESAFQLGVTSTVGVDTQLDGGVPFFFRVTVLIPTTRLGDRDKVAEVSRAIVDQQKPAHTYYTLTVETPVFQVGVQSTVGVDTVLG